MTKKGCLKCHGPKEDAPKGRVLRYPGLGGYDYKRNTVVGTFVTYVPMEKAMAQLRLVALRTVLIGIPGILVMVLVVWLFMAKMVTNPLTELAYLADDISQGKQISREIKANSSDEIGTLYAYLNRMRISILKLVKAVKRV